MSDGRKLIDRLLVIAGEERAGNKNFHEKVRVMYMACSQFTNFVVSNSKIIGFLIKIIHLLPPKFWQEAAAGIGLVNNSISNVPF